MKNDYGGTHLIIELYDVKFDKLNNSNQIKECLESSALVSGATILYSYFHVSRTITYFSSVH